MLLLVGNRKRSYIANRCIEIDNLPGRHGVIDTDGESVRKRNDYKVTVVKIFSHGWDFGFDRKCNVGWGKLCGQLPAFIAIEPGEALLYTSR